MIYYDNRRPEDDDARVRTDEQHTLLFERHGSNGRSAREAEIAGDVDAAAAAVCAQHPAASGVRSGNEARQRKQSGRSSVFLAGVARVASALGVAGSEAHASREQEYLDLNAHQAWSMKVTRSGMGSDHEDVSVCSDQIGARSHVIYSKQKEHLEIPRTSGDLQDSDSGYVSEQDTTVPSEDTSQGLLREWALVETPLDYEENSNSLVQDLLFAIRHRAVNDPSSTPPVWLADLIACADHCKKLYAQEETITPVERSLQTQVVEDCTNTIPELAMEDSSLPFTLGSKRYVALPPVASMSEGSSIRPRLLTLVSLDIPSPWSLQDVCHLLHGDEDSDDVDDESFRKFFVFCNLFGRAATISKELQQHMQEHALAYTRSNVEIEAAQTRASLPVGPYLWQHGALRPICRLHDDTHSAIFASVIPERDCNTPFRELRIGGLEAQTSAVAVPSRRGVKSSKNRTSAIQQKRIIVKDNLRLAGLRISACDLAYYSLAPQERKTARLIQRLVERGACIVGTAKLSSMISKEEPCESLDYQVPFNPRGDRYQSPAGSSSGSAAAIAAYEWLDYGVGTDSTGSGRRPAFVCGCFAIRLSYDMKYLDDMMPCFPRFDAPALFSRTIRGMADFIQEWIEPPPTALAAKIPLLIYLQDGLPHECPGQMSMIEDFVSDFTEYEDVPGEKSVVKRLSLHEAWQMNPPAKAQGKSLEQYLADCGKNTFLYEFFHSTDQFRAVYRAKHGEGSQPAVNTVTAFRWDVAKEITDEDHLDAVNRLEVYKTWLEDLFFGDERYEAYVLMPIAPAAPNYRNSTPSEPFVQDAWEPLLLAPTLQAPELTIPIGEISFESQITKTEEWLPVGISLLGRPGSDVSLVRFAEKLLPSSGWPLEVVTGRRLFASPS